MPVTAPPRLPRPSDPVDREELEALVEALIEEARQRARRRRRIYWAVAASVALVGVAVFARSRAHRTVAEPASRALSARPSLAAGAASSKIAFIRHVRSGRATPQIYVMNADGSWRARRLDRPRVARSDPAWAPDGRKIAFTNRSGGNWDDLRHERRRQRAAKADARPGDRRRRDLVSRRQKLAFVTARAGKRGIYVTDAEGSRSGVDAQPLERGLVARWPDDRLLQAAAAAIPGIYMINADGSGRRRLTHSGARSPSGLVARQQAHRLRASTRRQ